MWLTRYLLIITVVIQVREERERGDEKERGGNEREKVKANKNTMKSYFVPLGVHLLICRCLSLKA